MATLSQINASRTNGARSKGPKTPEGKARVAQNGTTHGIYSRYVVLQNEDTEVYNESRDAHLLEWTPATPSEYNLVIDIVDARWRLRRFSTLETAAIDFEVQRMRPEIGELFERIDEPTRTVIAFNALITNNRTFEVLQSAIRHQHRIIDRATNQLRRLRRDRLENGNNDPDHDGGGGGGSRGTTARQPEPAAPSQTAAQSAPAQPPAPAAPPPAAASKNTGTKPEPPVACTPAARHHAPSVPAVGDACPVRHAAAPPLTRAAAI